MKKMRVLLMVEGSVYDSFNAFDLPIPRKGEFVLCGGINHTVAKVVYSFDEAKVVYSFDEDIPYAKVYLEASK